MDLYTTAALYGLLEEVVATPHAFALNMFFPEEINSDEEEIHFDKLPLDDIIAPFVAPSLPGHMMAHQGFNTEVFKPAYVKPKHAVSPAQALKRRPGESYTAPLSPAQRRDLYVADLLEKQRRSIMRRKEWMAWQVLKTGKVVVEGDNYPSVTVDFGRTAGHTEALTDDDTWDTSGFNLIKFFNDRATKIQAATGFAGTTHVMGTEAWNIASNNDDFIAKLDNRRQETGQMELGPYGLADGDADAAITSGRYMGSMGDHDFYVFAGQYTDIADQTRKLYLPTDACLSAAPRGLSGMFAHGAILDHESLMPVDLFPKMWDQDDPSVRYVMTQSAPLPIPGRIDATNYAVVKE